MWNGSCVSGLTECFNDEITFPLPVISGKGVAKSGTLHPLGSQRYVPLQRPIADCCAGHLGCVAAAKGLRGLLPKGYDWQEVAVSLSGRQETRYVLVLPTGEFLRMRTVWSEMLLNEACAYLTYEDGSAPVCILERAVRLALLVTKILAGCEEIGEVRTLLAQTWTIRADAMNRVVSRNELLAPMEDLRGQATEQLGGLSSQPCVVFARDFRPVLAPAA